MSGTNSDITIECEPINVSGEIEIEKVNKITFNPFMNRKINKKKATGEQKSMLVGFIFLTLAIPLLIVSFDKLSFIFKSGLSINDLPNGPRGIAGKYVLGINLFFGIIFILIAGLGIGKVLK